MHIIILRVNVKCNFVLAVIWLVVSNIFKLNGTPNFFSFILCCTESINHGFKALLLIVSCIVLLGIL